MGREMSKIQSGQKFNGTNAAILNKEFAATNANGQPLAGWGRSAWPCGAPFLKNKSFKKFGEAVVWFPVVVDNPNKSGARDWRTVANEDRSMITSEYIGENPLEETKKQVSPFIGKLHIVFAKNGDGGREFYGIYTSELQGDKFVYRRIATTIDTSDWQR